LVPLGLRPLEGLLVQVDPWLETVSLAELDVEGPVVLTRQRTPGFDEPGLFGVGWRSEVESRLLPQGDGFLVARADGLRRFVPAADGAWVSVLGDVEWLVRHEDGDFTLGERERVLRFDDQGRLEAVTPGYRVERSPGRLRLIADDGQALALVLDADGRVTRAEREGAESVTYTYSEAGELLARGGARPRRYEIEDGWVAVVIEGDVRLELSADAEGRLVRLEQGRDRAVFAYADEALTMDATPGGRWVFHRLEDGWRVESPSDTARVWFDERGRITAQQVAGGPIQQTRFDALGRPLPTGTLPSGAELAPALDEAGRLAALRGPDGASETYRYGEDGRLTGYQAADGSQHRLEYAAGELSARHDPSGATRYERDEAGRLLAAVTPAGRRWTFRRDEAGRTVASDGPGGPQTLVYDRGGQLSGRRDASGREWFYLRDGAGQLEEVVAKDGAQLELRHDQAGRPTRLQAGGEVIELSYDGQGRLAAAQAGEHGLSYQREGRFEMIDTPWGALTRERDPQGRLVALDTAAGTFRFRYDRHGRQTEIVYPNGVTTRVGYDALGNEARRLAEGPDGPVLAIEATRDAHHALVAVSRDGQERRLERDTAGRLIAVEGPGLSRRYGYDADGNRTAKDEARWRYDARGRLVATGDDPVEHDPAGRLLTRGGDGSQVRCRYDGFGRLAEVRRGGRQVRYTYDPLGRPVTRTLDGETVRYVYESDQLLAEVGPGERLRLYVHGPGTDHPLAYWEDGAWTFLHTDDQGTVLAYSDAEGERLDGASFTPFGELVEGPGQGRPVFWAGRPVDREAGLVELRARFYDPELGRFLTPDPAGLAGGINAYAYAENQPLSARDPEGLWGLPTSFEELAAAAKAVVTAPYRLGQAVGRGALAGAAKVRGLVVSDLERKTAEERRLWLSLIRLGVLNPPDRTPAYTSTWRNLIQPGLDRAAGLIFDGLAGRRAILTDVLQAGPAALTRDGPLGAVVHEVAQLPVRAWRDYNAHQLEVFETLAAGGYALEGQQAIGTWALGTALGVAEVSGGREAYEVATGLDLRAFVDDEQVRHFEPHERVRKGLFLGLDALLAGRGKELGRLGRGAQGRARGPRARARPRPASTPSAPRAPPARSQGVVQALGGEAPPPAAALASPPGPVRRLRTAQPGEGLPGSQGIELPRNPTDAELADLSRRHGVEFAVVYEHGPGPNGGGGTHYLFSGTPSGVAPGPLGPGRIIKTHTHPSGITYPSEADLAAMRGAARNGSPQRTSHIVAANPELPNYGTRERFGDLPRGPVSDAQLRAPLRHPEGSPLRASAVSPPGRPARELGGFKRGISAEEIRRINRRLGGEQQLTGDISSALAAAARREGFWNKTAAIVREIAGGHVFNDANKRTALEVVRELTRRNDVLSGVSEKRMRAVIAEVAEGKLRDVRQIAKALRGT
jgi:RHS repeat-associated protein